MIIFQKVFKLQSGHQNVYEWMYGRMYVQMTDGCQAHPYIPRTFRSGDKGQLSWYSNIYIKFQDHKSTGSGVKDFKSFIFL